MQAVPRPAIIAVRVEAKGAGMSERDVLATELMACGYVLPGDPAAVLDINYQLLEETLTVRATAPADEPEPPMMAD